MALELILKPTFRCYRPASTQILSRKDAYSMPTLILLKLSNTFVDTKMAGMYVKCGSFEDARQLFDKMSKINNFAWSAMIGAYAREQRWESILQLFTKMIREGLVPDGFLFPKMVQACPDLGDVKMRKLAHSIVIRGGFDDGSIRVCNPLLASYCGLVMETMQKMVDSSIVLDVLTRTRMLLCFTQNDRTKQALDLFREILFAGTKPTESLLFCAISAYSTLKPLKKEGEAHSIAVKLGLGSANDLLLHHVDGLTQSGVRQLLEAKTGCSRDVINLTGDSGHVWGAAMCSAQGSSKPIFISIGHRISLETAIKVVKMCCKYRIPEPVRQADIRSRAYLQKQGANLKAT